MKKMMALFMTIMVLMTSVGFAAPVSVNGQTQKLDIIETGGRQYIAGPALKSFGLTSSVNGNDLTLKHKAVTFEFKANSNAVKINGVPMTLDSQPVLKNKTPYFPLRFVMETMNYGVGYDSKSKQVLLKANKAASFPVTINDDKLSYTFKKPVKKIVSLAPSMTEILFAIGAGDLVVGRTKYCTYPPEASKIQSVGTLYEPDLEGILKLKPELVIAGTHMNEDVLKMLDKAEIQTATQKSAEKIDEIFTLINNLGVITQNDYSARALVSSLKGKITRIENIVKKIPDSQKKTVYYVVGTGKKEFTAGKDTFINDVFTRAGGLNVATDVTGWAYTLEKLIAHNPEYLFGEARGKETMLGSSNYASLTALKSDKFVVIDNSIYSIPGPRVIDLGMKAIIEILYPTYAKELNY